MPEKPAGFGHGDSPQIGLVSEQRLKEDGHRAEREGPQSGAHLSWTARQLDQNPVSGNQSSFGELSGRPAAHPGQIAGGPSPTPGRPEGHSFGVPLEPFQQQMA